MDSHVLICFLACTSTLFALESMHRISGISVKGHHEGETITVKRFTLVFVFTLASSAEVDVCGRENASLPSSFLPSHRASIIGTSSPTSDGGPVLIPVPSLSPAFSLDVDCTCSCSRSRCGADMIVRKSRTLTVGKRTAVPHSKGMSRQHARVSAPGSSTGKRPARIPAITKLSPEGCDELEGWGEASGSTDTDGQAVLVGCRLEITSSRVNGWCRCTSGGTWRTAVRPSDGGLS